MKPSRLLLIWLAILLAIGIVLGALRALELAVPSSLLSINWGLLLALLALAVGDIAFTQPVELRGTKQLLAMRLLELGQVGKSRKPA